MARAKRTKQQKLQPMDRSNFTSLGVTILTDRDYPVIKSVFVDGDRTINAIMKRTGLDDAEVMKSINRINNYSRQGIGRDAILVPTHTFDNTPCALCTDSDGKGGEQPMGFCGLTEGNRQTCASPSADSRNPSC